MEVIIFGIKLTLNPIAFSIPIGKGHWDIYWYGIIIALGFALALIYGYKNAARFNINLDRMLDVIIVVVPISVLCARAYYVIFDGVKLNGIADFFGFASSGFSGIAIYGAVIGAFASGAIMCWLRKVNILDMFDLAAIGFLIGQGIGRWGNFVNQEAFGTYTGSSWWGMQSINTISELGKPGMVHPCFLYESIWCLIGVFVLHKISKNRLFKGQILLCYCVWYGFERGFLELIRTDSLMWGSIRVSSLLSFTICIGAAIALYMITKRVRASAEAITYEGVFELEEETTDIEEDLNFSEENGEDKND